MILSLAMSADDSLPDELERGALLDHLELQLADLEESAAQADTAARMAAAAEKITVPSFERRRPARRPLPAHLPRERIVYPARSLSGR